MLVCHGCNNITHALRYTIALDLAPHGSDLCATSANCPDSFDGDGRYTDASTPHPYKDFWLDNETVAYPDDPSTDANPRGKAPAARYTLLQWQASDQGQPP